MGSAPVQGCSCINLYMLASSCCIIKTLYNSPAKLLIVHCVGGSKDRALLHTAHGSAIQHCSGKYSTMVNPAMQAHPLSSKPRKLPPLPLKFNCAGVGPTQPDGVAL